ncbi:hypothetical protein AX774_g4200 [Zancudomyces culisetae]|uniref:Uncharacterized protein n=1 Tax=Zancudomyces culisetae TaxID=1213189 RepID=A0A1R1PMX6_ZANCU|nr:hypothetical protein AX774_g4200 [Zancudomyces culisetae]|eukprot:OMH82319.1 hypothetical protein AX774_g4200 [Zancudomyces culisetae]
MQNELPASYISKRMECRRDAINILKNGGIAIYKRCDTDEFGPSFLENVERHQARYADSIYAQFGFRVSECTNMFTYLIVDEEHNTLGFVQRSKPRTKPESESEKSEVSEISGIPKENSISLPFDPMRVWSVFNAAGQYAFTVVMNETGNSTTTYVMNYKFNHWFATTIAEFEDKGSRVDLYTSDEDSPFGCFCAPVVECPHGTMILDDEQSKCNNNVGKYRCDMCEAEEAEVALKFDEYVVLFNKLNRTMAMMAFDKEFGSALMHFNGDFKIRGFNSVLKAPQNGYVSACPFIKGEEVRSTLEQRAAVFSTVFYKKLFPVVDGDGEEK